MADRRIRALPRPTTIDILSEDGLAAIREASLEVLERTGIEVRSERLLKELGAAGAVIDTDAGHARFPRDVVEGALALMPDLPMLCSREPGLDLVLDGAHGFLGVDGSAAEILDLDTDVKRSSTKADLAQATRLADAVDELAYIWQPVASRDVRVIAEPLHDLDAQLPNTGKHLMLMTAVTGDQARACAEMATIAAGGESNMRERPTLSAFQCSVSPLVYDGGPLEAAVEFGRAGVPSGFMVMPITAATSPITKAGTLVISNAEVIAGVVALQLLAPGSKTFYGSCATTMDMRSGAATCGGPEDLLYQMASAQLARSYGMRSCIGTFATGSKVTDWQAGVENGMSGMASWLSGVDLFSGAGLLYAARVFSPIQMLLDTETFDLMTRMSEGVPTTREDLAVDVIAAVGPGTHFLDQDHTLERMREPWQTKYFNRDAWEDWEAAGRPTPKDRARERAHGLLDSHEPYPLPDGADAEIRKIIDEYEATHEDD